MFINPHNPCGRIWSKEELTRIKDLVIKHKCFLFSDEIYADSADVGSFTSMLAFEDLHPHLIYASSYSKTWNCSGMPLSYSIAFDPVIHQKMNAQLDLSLVAFPCALSYALLEACYSSEEALEWRLNTLEYIQSNYRLFKHEC